MAARKLRTTAQRDAVLAEIARRYRAGETQAEIAYAISVLLGESFSQQQVSNYLPRLWAYWRTQAGADMDAKLRQELAKLDAIEVEALAEYTRSKKPAVTVVKQQGGKDGGKVVTTTEGRIGDPRFLAIAQACGQERCKLLALYPATPTAASGAGPALVIREVEVRLHREPVAG